MFRLPSVVLILASIARPAMAEQSQPHFETHIRAIFKHHCFQCHGEEPELQGGLDVRLVRLLQAGGDTGAAIVPGQADDSLLLQRLTDGEMPPGEGQHLSVEEIATIRDWIDAGAKTLRPEPETLDHAALITEEERAHWSFQPTARPAVPEVSATDRVANPIDAFLLKQLEAEGSTFSSRATPRALLRRVYFDLLGLPPAPQDMQTFAARHDAQAWKELVNRLLDDEAYGERWARHWLDVAGYADSEGYSDVDAPRPHAWRYRDYVIRAFQSDKPFDEFIREQLAGDELVTSPLQNLSPGDRELLAATGFLRMAPDGTGGAVPDTHTARNDTIADTIRIVSSSLMGLTVGCAQCHDHRYDPISQVDYYRFRAIFEPAFDWQKWRKPSQRLISLYTDEQRNQAAQVEAAAKKIDARRTEKQKTFINATFEKQLEKVPADIHDAARAAHQTAAKSRTPEQLALFRRYPSLNVTAGSLYLYDRKAADELKALAAEAATVRSTRPPQHFVRALTEVQGQVPTTHLFFRGDHQQPKQELQPGGLTVISTNVELQEIPVNAAAVPTTGRRLALAQRLTSSQHPLTARVIVNRIWLHHFGRGLVSSVGDFGLMGQPPTHPRLLDWLAAEFIESGWSVKHVHRLILNSNAWQQQLRNDPRQDVADPDNLLYGGARLRRMEAEVLRDSMLAVSGRLNRKSFGPPVPVMADRVGRFVIGKENLNAGRPGDKIDLKGEEWRRSIYVQVRRSRPLSILDAFDRPAMAPNCDRRRPSTGSPQSLLMLNSELLLEYSRRLAERLATEANGDTPAQVELAWQLVYSRSPTPVEEAAALQFLQDQTAVFEDQQAYQPQGDKPPARTASREAAALLCQMLFSSSEFLYVD